MQLLVGTDPVLLPLDGSSTPLVQNLGPGDVWWDSDENVDADSGLLLPAGVMYEFPRDLGQGSGRVWLVATVANTDVRIVAVG